MKIKTEFIVDQYKSGIENYSELTKEVGLWESEKYVFEKYLQHNHKILDLGCGTGRTTFPLYQLGYIDIVGVDLTPEMIAEANSLKEHFKIPIVFKVGDALALDFEDETFDAVIFSFNGFMSIPQKENREKALREINRVLKPNGLFIFTTHDRKEEPQYYNFWKEEKDKWEQGNQNQALYEYGDLITKTKNEKREIYIHIPDRKEVENCLTENCFNILETFYRSEKFDESKMVKDKSGECRFWIARKA